MADSVLLIQFDGKLPNVALMRIAAHHRVKGDTVELRRVGNRAALERDFFEARPDRLYASLIFTRSRPLAERLLEIRPDSIIGGTGWDLGKPLTERSTLEKIGIGLAQDYTLYPAFTASIGFSQRGCRLACSFCDVSKAEPGGARREQGVFAVYRGDPAPRHLLLLDNDPFGPPDWRDTFRDLRDGNFKVCFSQGINARFLDDEAAEAMVSVDYRDDAFNDKRIYTAWDNLRDEERLFTGLERLTSRGVKPDDLMVYVLCGWQDTLEDRLYRVKALRAFGARPYPMPFDRSRRDLTGFARWVIGAYDKRIPWPEWEAAGYRPERLVNHEPLPLFDGTAS